MILNKSTIIYGMLFFLISSTNLAYSKEKKDPNVIYKYKKYERFDLGNLEVKGEVLAPGDLSILERERKIFDLNLLDRKDFDEENIEDILLLR